jgi:DMSO/TMAO reductase YedYZ molybdopterin-dependent catalytic subunit
MMDRRRFLNAGLIGSAMTVSGCKIFDSAGRGNNATRSILMSANDLTYRAQRLISGDALAPEYTQADIRQGMKPNGVTNPEDADYQTLAAGGFADWRLRVSGMVDTPTEYTLAQLQAMPSRTQITRHDCVEGWSCIAKWMGVPLHTVLAAAKPTAAARFVVFHCHDTIEKSLSGAVKYYESIDLRDALHPQTILAYGMNDTPLPIRNGAPLRLRVERQLGYKMPKYLHRIELVSGLDGFGGGKGGYWEDKGYEWYGGI